MGQNSNPCQLLDFIFTIFKAMVSFLTGIRTRYLMQKSKVPV